MVKSFFNIYQYIVFLIIFPLTTYLWYKIWGKTDFTVLTLSLPIITAYIVPAIGTNITKLWEFNTKLMVGKFRIYHGFVLGSVTSLFALIFYYISPNYNGILKSFLISFIFATFISFWNYFYDVYAVKCGFIKINNKMAYENKSAYEIVADYAPVYFFCFGFIYSAYVELLKYYYNSMEFSYNIIVLLHILALILPTGIYAIFSKIYNKTWGICKYLQKDNEL